MEGTYANCSKQSGAAEDDKGSIKCIEIGDKNFENKEQVSALKR